MKTDFQEEELLQQQEAVKIYLADLLNSEPKTEKKLNVRSEIVPKAKYIDDLIDDNIKPSSFFVPSWASSRFSNSVIRVCGLKLLIPTQFVRGVRRIHQPIIPVTKNISWLKGRYRKNFEDILVINTKFLVYGREEFIPSKYRADKDIYVVVVGNGKWGFACESIGHGINLSSKEVSWRSKQGKRRWLAGTSVDNKNVIIDIRRVELSLIMDGVLV